jgi:NAD(P)H-flavin reductase
MPVAQEFHRLGADVTSIIGFRSEDLVILEEEFNECSDTLYVMTDDGSLTKMKFKQEEALWKNMYVTYAVMFTIQKLAILTTE